MIADALKGTAYRAGCDCARLEAEYEGRPPIDPVGCAGRIVEYEQLRTADTPSPAGDHALSRDPRRAGKAYRLAHVTCVASHEPEAGSRCGRAREQLEALLSAAGMELAGGGPGRDERVVDTVAQYHSDASERRQQILEMDGRAPARASSNCCRPQ